MIQEPRHYQTQLAIIGSGLAGLAASVFAGNRGIRAAQVGNTGALAYTTGYFDLLGCHPVAEGRCLDDPWAGLAALRQDEPLHPLARVADADIRTAFNELVVALDRLGLGYSGPGERNLQALSPAGTAKPTLCVPLTMRGGVDAHAERRATLLIDFVGLKGYSARQVAANLRSDWPGLTTARLAFPQMEQGAEVYPEVMARALEVPATREQLAERIRPALDEAQSQSGVEIDAVGVPAILGVHGSGLVHAELERLIGVSLFEIPTMPPSVPGTRLRELFEQRFPSDQLALVPQQKVQQLELGETGARLSLQDSFGQVSIEAETLILATGRFLSGGLEAGVSGLRETLLDLPVTQPDGRGGWYRERYLDPRGHAVNRAGVEVDERFRPLASNGKPLSPRLFAAGILLAHQDWIRQRCGAGVAIATAYRAVTEAAKELGISQSAAA
jgi:glycerol-3-phosphate dehydrogenase subunit B